MIYTNYQQMERYLGVSDALDTAIRYLKTADLSQLQFGRNDVDGDNVYINRFDYNTLPLEKAAWEGHAQYADIHVLLSGEEKIGVTDVSRLKATTRDEATDFIGYEGPVETWFTMHPGDVLVVFPEDVHMVKVQLNGEAHVQKAVFKVRA